MPSTYTTNLGIEKPATGEQAGVWGVTVNTNYDMFDQAIAGQADVTLAATGSSGAPNTLAITDGAVSDGRNIYVNVIDGGDLGGDAYLQLTPNDAEKVMWIKNSLTASRSIYIFQGTYNASNDYVLLNGHVALLKFDGAGAGAVVTLLDDGKILDTLRIAETLTVDGDTTTGTNGSQKAAIFGNDLLTADDNFWLGTYDNTNIKPALVFDDAGSSLDCIYYLRSTDSMIFSIANVNKLMVSPTEITVSDDLSIRDEIFNWAGNQVVRFSSGASAGAGANLCLHGDIETNAYDVEFKSGSTTELQFDASANTWDFQANLLTTTGSLTCGTFTSTGIDDNATGNRVRIENGITYFGQGSGEADYILSVGQADTMLGVLYLNGNGAGSTEGGLLYLQTAADHDSVYTTFAIRANEDDLAFGYNTSYTAGLVYSPTTTLWDFQANAIKTTSNVSGAYFLNYQTNAFVGISGSTSGATGGNLILYGESHATTPYDIRFRSDTTTELQFDYSANLWDFQANAITTTGALTCGAFTSVGIDDNASGERVQINDSVTQFGTGILNYYLATPSNTMSLTITGDIGGGDGAVLRLYASAHATQAHDFDFRAATATELYYDHSASLWDFQANDITTTGTVTGTSLAGTLTTAAQPNITSLGTLTSLTVDFLTLNGSGITTSSGDIFLTASNLIYSGTIFLGTASGPKIVTGSGSPEGSVTGKVGSLYMDTAGGASTTLYVKESGTGNTGWVAK